MSEEDKPREVWLAGNEVIRLVSDLLEPKKEKSRPDGSSTRLAVEYAQAALKLPGFKVIVIDHIDIPQSNTSLLYKVRKIMDALDVDYSVGESKVDGFTVHPFIVVKPIDRVKLYPTWGHP